MIRAPSWFVGAVCEPAWDLYERSDRLRTLRELERSQWWEHGRLSELRVKRLRQIVTHAVRTCPFYAKRFVTAGIDPASVRDLGDLRTLPLLTKQDVRRELPYLVSRLIRRNDLVSARTGGSTGVALQVYCDRLGVQRRAGAALRADRWAGWRLGEPIAAVWGNPPVATSWRNKLRLYFKDRYFYLDTMHFNEAVVAQFIADWSKWRPGLLYGHAHSLFLLAEAVAELGFELRPRAVVATSMMLIRPEREVIERTFGVPVTNRYGCEEVSLIACECERHEHWHLNAEHLYVEFLRDDGSACRSGEEGRIVVTDLVNYGMPMLRYEVGDRGAPFGGKCDCGRSLPLMTALSGRTADFLLAADGSRVAGISLIENTLTRYEGIVQLQLIQKVPLQLDANVVPGPGWGDDVAAALVDELRHHLGKDFEIEIKLVERITREPSGKFRFSICRI